jgi:hypothetical protein
MRHGNQKNEPNNAGGPNSRMTEYSFANQLIPHPITLSSMMATRFGRRRAPRMELLRARSAVIIGLLRMLVWGADFGDGG